MSDKPKKEKADKDKGDKEKADKDKGDKSKKEKKDKEDKPSGPLNEAQFPASLKHGGAKYVRFMVDASTPGYALESDQSNPTRQWKAKWEPAKEKLFFSNIADKTQRVWKLPGAEDLGLPAAAAADDGKKDKKGKEKKDKDSKKEKKGGGDDSPGVSRPDTPSGSQRGGGGGGDDDDSDDDNNNNNTNNNISTNRAVSSVGASASPAKRDDFGDDDDNNTNTATSAAAAAEAAKAAAEAEKQRRQQKEIAETAEAEARRQKQKDEEQKAAAAAAEAAETERKRKLLQQQAEAAAEGERRRQQKEKDAAAAALVEQQRAEALKREHDTAASRIKEAELQFQRERESELEHQKRLEKEAAVEKEREREREAERVQQAQKQRERDEAEERQRKEEAAAAAERERIKEQERQKKAQQEAEKLAAQKKADVEQQRQKKQQEEAEAAAATAAAELKRKQHQKVEATTTAKPATTPAARSADKTSAEALDQEAAAIKIQALQRGRAERERYEQKIAALGVSSSSSSSPVSRDSVHLQQQQQTVSSSASAARIVKPATAPAGAAATTTNVGVRPTAATATAATPAAEVANINMSIPTIITTTPAQIAAHGLPIHMYSDEERDRLRDRLKLFFDTFAPSEAGNIGRLAMGSSSTNLTEERLFEQLEQRHMVPLQQELLLAAEQNLLPEQHRFGVTCRDTRGTERDRLRGRLQLFFSTYFPGGVAKVGDALSLELCEAAVFHTLCTKYEVDKSEEAEAALERGVYPEGLPVPRGAAAAGGSFSASRKRGQLPSADQQQTQGPPSRGSRSSSNSVGTLLAQQQQQPQQQRASTEPSEESLRRHRAEAAAEFAAAAARHDVPIYSGSNYNSEVEAIVAPVSAIIEHSRYITDMLERDKQRLLCAAVDTLMLDHAAAALAASKIYSDFVLRMTETAKREISSVSPHRSSNSSNQYQQKHAASAQSPQQLQAMQIYHQGIQQAAPPSGPVRPVEIQSMQQQQPPYASPASSAAAAPSSSSMDFVMTSDASRQQFSQQIKHHRAGGGAPTEQQQQQQQVLVPSYWRKIRTPPSGHNPHAYAQMPPVDPYSAAAHQQQQIYCGSSPPMHSPSSHQQQSMMTINGASPIPLTSPGGFIGGPTAGAGMTAAAAAQQQFINAHPPGGSSSANSPMTTFLQWDSRRSGAVLLSADRTSARMIPPYHTLEMDRLSGGGGFDNAVGAISKHKYAPEFFLIGTIGIARGEFVFEVTVELPEAAFSPDNFFAVGVASKYYRGPAGRKCMAYMLRSDGSLLTHSDSNIGISYAHSLSRKAVITVHLNLNRWEMAYYVDGVPLGVAFRFTPTHDPEPLFPVACFGPKGGMIELQRPTAATLPENVSPGRIAQWPELNEKGLPAAFASPGTPQSMLF